MTSLLKPVTTQISDIPASSQALVTQSSIGISRTLNIGFGRSDFILLP